MGGKKRPKTEEIEVTPRMIRVGIGVLEGARGALPDEELVSEVYRAMQLASPPRGSSIEGR
jgi:hypothetical protein